MGEEISFDVELSDNILANSNSKRQFNPVHFKLVIFVLTPLTL